VIETDVAIIGAGAAGLSAAEAAARAGRQVLVVERLGAGGQVMTVENIANLPEFPEGISGFELGPLLQERAEAAGAQFLLDTVLRLESREGAHLLHCEAETVRARAVIVAAGSVRRSLGVPGEDALQGRGVSHCASCDGPLFRGQAVCVVGGGDAGFGEAQVLAGHAASVTIVFREREPRAQGYLRDAVSALPNVTCVPGAEVIAIEGEGEASAVRIRLGDGTQRSLPAQGVFVCAGLQAASAFLDGVLERDPDGRIRTDDRWRTSVPGVFAAGDIRAGAAFLLAAAAAEGAQAAAEALRHLEEAAA
jgi:thioredoxin reductase (NADPH)